MSILEFINNLLKPEIYTTYLGHEWQGNTLLYTGLPIYFILIPLEIIISNVQLKKWYSWKETLSNIYLNIVNTILDSLFRIVALGVLFYIYQYQFIQWEKGFLYWFLLFIFEDLLFYFEHRIDHFVRIFWAVHYTHHSSEEYNLTTGFRSSVLMPLYRFVYFIPLAFLGFHPIDIAFMYAITQVYGILVHTQAIKTMPHWFEIIFVSPSHHRVHHASNICYLDKNMGMCLIIWDKLFGTFQEELESEPIVYGTVTKPTQPYHPINMIFFEWQKILHDIKKKNITFKQRIQYLIMPPGWSHDGSTQTSKELRKGL